MYLFAEYCLEQRIHNKTFVKVEFNSSYVRCDGFDSTVLNSYITFAKVYPRYLPSDVAFLCSILWTFLSQVVSSLPLSFQKNEGNFSNYQLKVTLKALKESSNIRRSKFKINKTSCKDGKKSEIRITFNWSICVVDFCCKPKYVNKNGKLLIVCRNKRR